MWRRPSAAALRLALGCAACAAGLGCAAAAAGGALRGGGRGLRGAPSAPLSRRLGKAETGLDLFFKDLELEGLAEPEGQSSLAGFGVLLMVGQLLFGVLYYCLAVSKYPKLFAPSQESALLQQSSEVTACCRSSCANRTLATCCGAPRAAHTFFATGTCGYWQSLCLMSCCPVLTLCYVGSCTDMNAKLGGMTKGWFTGFLSSCCCFCCVIAQDAQSLDLATGASTGCCGSQLPPMDDMACCLTPQQVDPQMQRQLHLHSQSMQQLMPVPAQQAGLSPERLPPPECLDLLCGANRLPLAPGTTAPPPRFVQPY